MIFRDISNGNLLNIRRNDYTNESRFYTSIMKYTCNNIQINAPNAENAAKTNICKDKKVKTIDEYENAYKEMIPSWVNTILLSISHNNNA